MGTANQVDGIIVMFDGVCNLCNGAVNFIIDHNASQTIRFAPLQSKFAKDLLSDHEEHICVDSIIVLAHQKLYAKSNAALLIASHLDKPWASLRWAKFLPKVFRDFIYGQIAANRYRWFGKRDNCRIPTEVLQHRFINSPIVS
ncbi:MAG: putative DCC family thiol-disulfide oxidoreductase YuxK [Cyclobacteriaceae bacterium]|jgi:predicted DCC family thiol-disulfide oxidoreductase YuxK